MRVIFRSLRVRHPVSDWDDVTGYLCQMPDPDGCVNQLIDRIQDAIAERDDSDDVSIEFDEHEANIIHPVFAAINERQAT